MHKKTRAGLSAKEAANDVPSWAQGDRPFTTENGRQFAERLLDEKYGKGNYPTGPGSEFSKIKKWGGRAFERRAKRRWRMTKVYVLQHVHALEDGEEDVKFIGVYSSRENAQAAMTRLGRAPGFCNALEGFHIDEYQVDKDQWVEGYSTLATA